MFKREQILLLKKRITEPRRFIQTLVGPRQIGKTTIINQLVKNSKIPYTFISADAQAGENSNWLDQEWENARLKLKSSGKTEYLLVVDEIQKIESWSETVKKNWDADTVSKTKIKVILLGSSRLLIQKGLTESLAGRFETILMNHWSYKEMKKAFGFTPEEYVWFGGYPGSASLIKDENRWKDYIRNSLIETTISKDILMLSRIDKPALLKRLFELSCIYSSQILSFNKMLGQLQDAGNTTTLSHYLDLLDASGLVTGLEKYSNEKVRSRSSSPKLQVLNTALFSVYTQHTFKEAIKDSILWGRCTESAIGAHLINQCKAANIELFYWRHRDDEVDYVLTYKNKTIAIEVKSGNKTRVSGISAFVKQFKPDKTYLVGSTGLTWQEFLLIDPVDLF